MRKWIGAMFIAVITVLAGCGGGGNGGGGIGIGLGPGWGGGGGGSGGGSGAQKIIIDSDYNTMSDDGQLGVMAAQLQADGKVQVMGISVVSGNQWLKQGVADALMSVERLGVGDRIGVYSGANYALNHTYADVEAEMAAGAGGDGYLGAWGGPEPKTDADLKPSPDGFAKRTVVQRKTAVDFIVDTVKANPGEITILAIGPLTNIALAVKQNPEIVPLIKKIIYMGGAVDVPGNTTKAAEFNWWFDPDAAQFVVRLPIPQVVVPLDVTDTVFLTKPIYDRIAHPAKPTAVTDVFQKLNGYGFDGKNGFENNPNYTQNIWDTLTLAYLIDPSYATQTVERYVDVIAKPGAADNGRSIGYSSQPAGATLQKMTVVKKFDSARFFELYVDLLTRPVPITLPATTN
ncbi:nucleoside hydrolase [Variovorax sp. NFACC27]|uniref:nucleoside hydrolase n=1 Tax=unclassified Variovorax TaxID=663243 RepID=UPI00089B847E|nr:Inosine-uridine nucleoside N-ribohydrolase [Variovorax sp. NFACC28]SEG97614.1 Inosine-uridine nucleoside N-ribohydrolase [Variovorax sp. NFACC29]SFD96670.1 Inosine-uridine nucleoside N-ribohydrolase [Variovorax sp. NFACC26]SFH11857.1 Inosine-uridine nucleoside N-ribohydrolase [Variovorax sp. NFACC27]